jgi:hypothetical protein
MDPHDPHCEMLATHDDYSLVERFDRQPKIVTMLRDPVARFLSSYEFAVEVSVRSFGNDVHTTNKQRVSTREIWPWEHCVRHIDNDLRSYKKRVDEDGVEGFYTKRVQQLGVHATARVRRAAHGAR